MTDKLFVCDLTEGTQIRSVLLASEASLRTTKSGNPFLALTLGDKSGTIDAKVWDQAEAIAERFDPGDFVRVQARVDSWKGSLQLNVRDLQRVDDDQFDIADFLPASRWARSEMLVQLEQLVSDYIESPEMGRFFDALFANDALMDRFAKAPAAKSNHHAYLGGLLEHTLSMARIGVRLSRHYTHYYPALLNPDLVIAGCVLHDIGKCFELSYRRSFDYTDDGQLVGHIVQGVELITETAAALDPPVPDDMLSQLKHLVLSHHGKKDYGSPVRPKTPEAMVLHEIDMIDSRMNMLANLADDHRQGPRSDQPWTDYQRLFQESIYLDNHDQSSWAPDDPDTAPAGPGAVPAPAAAPTPRATDANAGRESEANLDLFTE